MWLVADPTVTSVASTTPNIWIDILCVAGIMAVSMFIGSFAGVTGMTVIGLIATLFCMGFSLFGTLALLGIIVIVSILCLIIA